MYITVHRGANQVGGCVTEYECSGYRIFVDYGDQLPGNERTDLHIEGLTTGDCSRSVLLITHYHGDHVGLVAEVDPDVTIYMGRKSLEIYRKYAEHMAKIPGPEGERYRKAAERAKTFKTFTHGKYIDDERFPTFLVTPISVDHSAFDSYAFLIEVKPHCDCPCTAILHTGDFRLHGAQDDRLLRSLKLGEHKGWVDYIVCDGTNVGRQSSGVTLEEADVMRNFEGAFRENMYNVVYTSSTNLERLFGLHHAAVRAGRIFVVDKFKKEMMDIAADSDNAHYRFGNEQTYKVLELEGGQEFLYKPKFDYLMRTKGYCLVACASDRFQQLLQKLPSDGRKTYLSMWSGYIKHASPAYNAHLAAALGQDYERLRQWHTSGHADADGLSKLFGGVRGLSGVIPIHTDDPLAFEAQFGDRWPVLLLTDGERKWLGNNEYCEGPGSLSDHIS